MADPGHPDIDAVRAIAQGSPEFRPHALQGRGLQALHLAALVALKMGVGGVVLAGQLIEGGPVIHGQPPEKAPAGKIVQDAVNGHFIHPAAGPDHLQDFLGPQGPGRGPQDFQDGQAQGRGLYPLAGQHLGKIAQVAHSKEIFQNQLSCNYNNTAWKKIKM
jgi:hypothetical protein